MIQLDIVNMVAMARYIKKNGRLIKDFIFFYSGTWIGLEN